VSAYVYGQIITSFASFVYTYVALLLLKVPGALILAIMAAIFDVLPMLGFVLAIVPATLMALSVSPGTSLGVIGLYVLFHILENYFIMPLVYGNRLRLSTLVVLLGILVGALLGGVVGAVLALPVIASYPIIERIWLKDVLGTAVISRHILQTQAEVGSDS
jgi:predicted PurR-regulated permease PerM